VSPFSESLFKIFAAKCKGNAKLSLCLTKHHAIKTFRESRGITLQLPSTSTDRLLHPQPEDVPCRGDKGKLIYRYKSKDKICQERPTKDGTVLILVMRTSKNLNR